MSDRFELDRIRERRLARRATTRRDPDPGSPAMVGRVASPASAIAVGKFLMVHPVAVLGAECEGCTPTLTAGAASVPVLLLGPRVPAPGDDLVCRFVDHRWVAERGGGRPGPPYGTVLSPNCSVPLPRVLYLTTTVPTPTDFCRQQFDNIFGNVYWQDSFPTSLTLTYMRYADSPFYSAFPPAGSAWISPTYAVRSDPRLPFWYPGKAGAYAMAFDCLGGGNFRLGDGVGPGWDFPGGVEGNEVDPFLLTVGNTTQGSPNTLKICGLNYTISG